MKLYEIDRALVDVIESGYSVDDETGEILFEPSDLERLECDRTAKLEGCALYLKGLQAECDAMKAECERLQARLKTRQRKADRISQYILSSMLYMGDASLDTPRVELRTRKSKAVEVYDMEKLPWEFRRRKMVETPDKTAIKKAIAEGETVPGAALVEHVSLAMK